MRAKYIVMDLDGMEVAHVFPDCIQHKDAVRLRAVTPVFHDANGDGGKAPPPVVSAGLFEIVNGALRVWGESVSLGIKSRSTDGEVILQSLSMMGLNPASHAARTLPPFYASPA